MKLFSYRLSLFCVMVFYAVVTVQAQQTNSPQPGTVIKKTVTVPVASPQNTITNGIKLKVKGLVVKQAFLVFNDEKKVPENNMVELNQQVNLRLVLDKGFKEINGKVFPGGSEKIMFSTGEVILESKDLYTDYDSVGVSPVDAKYITLKAVISEIKDKSNSVIISFKVWDKKTSLNEISGSYIIHIK